MNTGVSEKILQVIEPLQLDPSLCVGLSFDSSSVMSGNKGVVNVILKQSFPRAVNVHSNSHRLNLGLCAASTVSRDISTLFDTVNNVHSTHERQQQTCRVCGSAKILEI